MFIMDKLRSSDLKVTQQRQLIIGSIANFNSPFSVEDLFHDGLKQAGIDLATIYRTLNLFVERGWLTQMEFGDGRARYWPTESHQHSHTLYCRHCHKIEVINDCLVEKQHDALVKKGFTRLVHKVEFTGICPACSQVNS